MWGGGGDRDRDKRVDTRHDCRGKGKRGSVWAEPERKSCLLYAASDAESRRAAAEARPAEPRPRPPPRAEGGSRCTGLAAWGTTLRVVH